MVSAAAAPVALIGGWTLAQTRQSAGFDPVTDTISGDHLRDHAGDLMNHDDVGVAALVVRRVGDAPPPLVMEVCARVQLSRRLMSRSWLDSGHGHEAIRGPAQPRAPGRGVTDAAPCARVAA